MKNIDSNPLLSTLWRIIRLHYEKSKNSFSLPSIFKSIPKNCQGSHERIFLHSIFQGCFALLFPRRLRFSLYPPPIESFHRHADAMALHLAQFHVNFARNTSGTRNTPGDNDMTPAYMTFDGNMWRCLTDARQIVISAHQMHVHGFKDRIKTSRSRGLFVCSFFVG